MVLEKKTKMSKSESSGLIVWNTVGHSKKVHSFHPPVIPSLVQVGCVIQSTFDLNNNLHWSHQNYMYASSVLYWL